MQVFEKQTDAPLDGIQVVPVRISHLFPHYVRCDDFQYIPCCGGCRKSERSAQIVLDLPCAMGMDIYCGTCTGLDRTVCVRILQHDADFHADWADRNGVFQTADMVCFLPDGDHDTDDLQTEKQGQQKHIIEKSRKTKAPLKRYRPSVRSFVNAEELIVPFRYSSR